MSILRLTVIRLKETPKFLVGEGKDDRVVETLQGLAHKYNRQCSLTLEKLQACGVTGDAGRRGSVAAHAKSRLSLMEVITHLRGLYETKHIGLSTSLIWFSWLLIGLAYPLYNVFLPTYLETRGAQFGQTSPYITWRNYAIVNVCGIFGPMLAGAMCASRLFWGRRGTMIIGALITMIFFFCYTQVRSASQNLGFNCAISFCLVRLATLEGENWKLTFNQNIYYGCLYAYTPEVLPSAHRGTGNGIAIGLNRIMGIMSAIIATYANVSTLRRDRSRHLYTHDTSSDRHSRPHLHLRRALRSHGPRSRHLPLRTIRQPQLMIPNSKYLHLSNPSPHI